MLKHSGFAHKSLCLLCAFDTVSTTLFVISSLQWACVGAVKCAIVGLTWLAIPNCGWSCAGNLPVSLSKSDVLMCVNFRVDKWQLSPSSQFKQLKAHTLPDGRVQVICVCVCWQASYCNHIHNSGSWFLLSATDYFLTGWRGDVQLGHLPATLKVCPTFA